ncbi:hypothetical protein ACRRTK_003665 [Alexandromys fortis]
MYPPLAFSSLFSLTFRALDLRTIHKFCSVVELKEGVGLLLSPPRSNGTML